MKKCPFCDAHIEENAKFCLYCMKEIDNKVIIKNKPAFKYKKWVLLFVVLLFIVALLLVLLKGKGNKNQATSSIPKTTKITENSTTASQPSRLTNTKRTQLKKTSKTNATSVEPQNSTKQSKTVNRSKKTIRVKKNKTTPRYTSNKKNKKTVGSTVYQIETTNKIIRNTTDKKTDETTDRTIRNTTKRTTIKTTVKVTTKATSKTSKTKATEAVKPTTTTQSKTQGKPSHTTITYTYTKAEAFAGYGTNDPNKDIVITGVQTIAKDGVYIIPETIDGKNVVAIKKGAFSGSDIVNTVKTVLIPSSVKCIYQGAFISCSNIADVYVMPDKIEIQDGSFPPWYNRNNTIIFHSSASCKERYGYQLSEFVDRVFRAEWSEWNKTIDF